MRLGVLISLSLMLAVGLAVVVGFFLFYVSAQTVLAAAAMMLGFILMYLLGLMTGRGWRRLTPWVHRVAPAPPRHWSTVR